MRSNTSFPLFLVLEQCQDSGKQPPATIDAINVNYRNANHWTLQTHGHGSCRPGGQGDNIPGHLQQVPGGHPHGEEDSGITSEKEFEADLESVKYTQHPSTHQELCVSLCVCVCVCVYLCVYLLCRGRDQLARREGPHRNKTNPPLAAIYYQCDEIIISL